ncbi:sensor histidine kinase [Methanoculleus frigidifontis]|nr:ATP-binding protein [Methanoculleus sp. FWC-SCC1]
MLAVVIVVALLGMTLYEAMKEFFLPDISKWESHLITIFFVTAMAAVLGYALIRNQRAVHTRQREMADALQRSRDFYLTIFDQLPNPIWRTDALGAVNYVNDAWLGFTGRMRAEELGDGWAAGVHPEDVERCLQTFREKFAGRFPFRMEYRLRYRDGTYRWILDHGKPVYEIDGAFGGYIGTCYDIHDEKTAKEEVERHIKQFFILNQITGVSTSALTLESMLAVILDKTLGLLEFSGGAIYLLSEDASAAELRTAKGIPEGLISKTISARHEPSSRIYLDGKAMYAEDWPALIDYGRSLEALEVMGVRSAAAVPLVAQGRVIGGLYVFDTEERAFTPEIRVTLESIGREIGGAIWKGILQQKLEGEIAKANLYLDIITHDINNVNSVALGYAQLMIETADGDDVQFARRVEQSIQQSIEIINNVSTIRRIHEEEPKLTPVPLDGVIRNAAARFPGASILYESSGMMVYADALLGTVLNNLIGNAVKFAGSEVEIVIRVDDRGDEACVSVEDTGPGIPDAMKPNIFNRFRRGTSKKSGKGLGLYISRMLIERYGGRIWAEDRVAGHPEAGAAVRFTLRRVTAAA